MEKYVRAMDVVYRICIWFAGAALIAMTLIYMIAIYARFRPDFWSFLDFLPYASTSWPEPTSNLCMKIFSFIGAAAAYRAGGHIAISLLTDRVSDSMKLTLRHTVNFFMLVMAIFIVWWGTIACMEAWHDIIPSTPWFTAGFTYTPVVIGSFLTALFVIESIIAGPQNHREIVKFGSPSAGH
jgi:TRAP-type C4-dicarboxylate transport system, small permease component